MSIMSQPKFQELDLEGIDGKCRVGMTMQVHLTIQPKDAARDWDPIAARQSEAVRTKVFALTMTTGDAYGAVSSKTLMLLIASTSAKGPREQHRDSE